MRITAFRHYLVVTSGEDDAVAALRRAAEELGRLAERIEVGEGSRDEFSGIAATIMGSVVRLYGPRPRAKAGHGAKWSILQRLSDRLGQRVHREELAVVAGIDDWARRLRELRVEHGYDIEHVENGWYVLHSRDPDTEKAAEWKTANRIRRKKLSVADKVKEIFSAYPGRVIRRDLLDYVAASKKEATRRARELRDEHGWPIISHIDDPDLAISEYMLLSADPSDRADPNQRQFPLATREAVFQRDGYRCQGCRRTRQEALAAGDTRFILEVDHAVGVAETSSMTDAEKADPSNLQTLCHGCHVEKTAAFQRERRRERRDR